MNIQKLQQLKKKGIQQDEMLLEVNNIHKSYGQLEVLRGVSLNLKPGEVVSLTGSSGAGKSTLLQIMGTLDHADQGSLRFKDINILELSATYQAYFRNQFLGFVFQFHHLLPEFTALENVCMPGLIAGEPFTSLRNPASELLKSLGLQSRLDHKPSQLSGGEQQRVAVARALINEPVMIFADEPTGNLDSANSQELFSLIRNLAHEKGVSFLIATHDQFLAENTDRSYRIQDGVLINEAAG